MADIALDCPGKNRSEAGLAAAFRRFGLVGFGVQAVLGLVPILTALLIFLFMPTTPALSTPLSVVGMLSGLSLAVLVFTAIWFLLYIRLGRRLAEPGARWTRRGLRRRVKVGVVAGVLGILFATIVILFEVGYLLFVLLDAPQAGVPVVQTDVAGASWISAVDMLSLLALNFTVTAEVVVLALSLVLLWGVTTAGPGPGERP